MKTCAFCNQEIRKRFPSYFDLVWSRSRFARSLGSVLRDNHYRIRYFFHRKCKGLFLKDRN